MLKTYEQNSQRKLVATILSVVIVAGIVVFADHLKAQTTSANGVASQRPPASTSSTTTSTPTSSTTSTHTTPTASSSTVKDGTYTASSSYYVPHGNESIKVSLTISHEVITAAAIQNSAGNQESGRYQEDFAASYKSYVIGKKISGLQLNVVAGASDTTQGFDDALSQIAAKAQS